MPDPAPSIFSRLLRDPLSHFLLAGAVLFALYGAFNGGPLGRDSQTIHVTDEALALWLQYRNKAFSPDQASAHLAAMEADKKEHLIADYVREESLYRHALTLGLDGNDAIIRQRLIQKMDYIALGMSEGGAAGQKAPSADEIRAYYQANQERYRQEGWATLTHIYFAGDNGENRAKAARYALTTGIDEPKGDRYLYRRNYVEASTALVKDHLGTAIATKAFNTATPLNEWLGPLRSPHGWHLVQVKKRQPATLPPLEEVAAQVMHDAARAKETDLRERAIEAILSQYKIVRAP